MEEINQIDWKGVAKLIATYVNITQNSYPVAIAHHISVHCNEAYKNMMSHCEFAGQVYPVLSAAATKYRLHLIEKSSITGILVKELYTEESATEFSETF